MPSSSLTRLTAAAIGASPGVGWLQQVLLHSPPEWYFELARRCSSSRPPASTRKIEIARWSWPGGWCAASFGTRSYVLPTASTSSTRGSPGSPWPLRPGGDEGFMALLCSTTCRRRSPAPCSSGPAGRSCARRAGGQAGAAPHGQHGHADRPRHARGVQLLGGAARHGRDGPVLRVGHRDRRLPAARAVFRG